MCDFHSVIVTGEGRILHLPENSHSGIARAHDLPEGLDAKWWECEWNGRGSMPVNLVQQRGKDSSPTAAALRAAEKHYQKLSLIVSGDLDPAQTFPFDAPEYSDVRIVYREAVSKREVEKREAESLEKVEPLAALLEGLDDDCIIAVIRALADQVSVSIEEIATEEIDAAREAGEGAGSEASYESGLQAGYESASEDMYSQDYMDEQIEEAVTKAKDEAEEEFLATGYEAGYMDAKRGKPPEYDFVGGMPSFLL